MKRRSVPQSIVASIAALTSVVALVSIAPVSIVMTASDAGAMSEGSGELGRGRLAVAVEVQDAGGRPVPVDAGSRSLPRLVHYVATRLPATGVGSIENLCQAGGAPATPDQVVFGWLYDVIEYARDGRVLTDTHTCVPLPDPGDPSVAPPSPVLPEAPTIGQVWRSVALPHPVVAANPVTRGVTGLETRLWSGGPKVAQVAVTVDGFTVSGTARVVEYRFATDEGYLGASDGPGDETRPAATHEFTTKGAHALSVSSVWHATATMRGPDFATPVPIDLDFAVLTSTADYPVTEVRSVLVG